MQKMINDAENGKNQPEVRPTPAGPVKWRYWPPEGPAWHSHCLSFTPGSNVPQKNCMEPVS
jgi:hypothetical protein